MIVEDNRTFFPTPKGLAKIMVSKIKRLNSSNLYKVLEPSAGQGDLLKVIQEHFKQFGSKVDYLAIEKDTNLVSNLYKFDDTQTLNDDFLTYDSSTYIDYIIANPPFDNGVKHLLKMISIAESQKGESCQIICLLNANTLENDFSNDRKHLNKLLDKYNAEITYMEETFLSDDTRRKTSVKVALVNLTVNTSDDIAKLFDDILNSFKEHDNGSDASLLPSVFELKNFEQSYHKQDIENLINLYKISVGRLKDYYQKAKEYQNTIRYLKHNESELNIQTYIKGYNDTFLGEEPTKGNFGKALNSLRKAIWESILKTNKFEKRLTNSSRELFKEKIIGLGHLEPTEKNVYEMLMALMQNSDDILKGSAIEMFDRVTNHNLSSFSKNIHYYNGWKTNDAFKLKKKFIVPIFGLSYWETIYITDDYDKLNYKVQTFIKDFMKILSLFMDNQPKEKDIFEIDKDNPKRFTNGSITFQVFHKGTIHVWVNDEIALGRLNYFVGQGKNWLPTDEEIKVNKDAETFIRKNFPELNKKTLK